jgi:hypothetical protein
LIALQAAFNIERATLPAILPKGPTSLMHSLHHCMLCSGSGQRASGFLNEGRSGDKLAIEFPLSQKRIHSLG